MNNYINSSLNMVRSCSSLLLIVPNIQQSERKTHNSLLCTYSYHSQYGDSQMVSFSGTSIWIVSRHVFRLCITWTGGQMAVVIRYMWKSANTAIHTGTLPGMKIFNLKCCNSSSTLFKIASLVKLNLGLNPACPLVYVVLISLRANSITQGVHEHWAP